jgi:hypothetical protein
VVVVVGGGVGVVDVVVGRACLPARLPACPPARLPACPATLPLPRSGVPS